MEPHDLVIVRKKSPLLLKIGKLIMAIIGLLGVVAGIALAATGQGTMIQAFLILTVAIISLGISLLRVQTVTCPHCEAEATIHTLTVDFECRRCLKPTAIKWKK
ncbi:hypothetical protein [Shouchella patagoniensis]|uniref:hypothetical protein n=1 Tax=Shouchella patagoniensis TaxID=228576 RepID=UPI000995A136|nr:hypothetical protein [Shouchella patagoniensis]